MDASTSGTRAGSAISTSVEPAACRWAWGVGTVCSDRAQPSAVGDGDPIYPSWSRVASGRHPACDVADTADASLKQANKVALHNKEEDAMFKLRRRTKFQHVIWADLLARCFINGHNGAVIESYAKLGSN